MGIASDKYDSVLVQLINQVSGFIERFTKRTLKETTYTNEVYDGPPSDTIVLRQFPVSSVSSFQYRETNDETDDWGTFNATTEYRVHADGRIQLINGEFQNVPRKYRVTYVAGYKIDFANEQTPTSHNLPPELEYATHKLVAALFNTRKSEGFGKVAVGDSNVTVQAAVFSSDEVKAILDKYAAPTI